MIVSTAKAQSAAEALGIALEGLNEEQLTAAYRAAAKLCHPDHHTDKAEAWARVSWARAALQHWLRHHPSEQTEMPNNICFNCDGKGRIAVAHKGFGKTLTMQCVTCKGLGTLIDNEVDND